MPETIDRLAKYRRPGQERAARPAQKAASGKKPYVAFQPSKEAKRHLEIRCRFPAPAECPLNSAVTNIRGEWRRGLAITLSYGKNMMVMIKGKGLQELFQMLKDWKVEWIEEFDPRLHALPTDAKAPFIKSITIQSGPPEEAPPMEQRH